MLAELMEACQKKGLIANGDSHKLLKAMIEKKVFSPGQAIFYGLCLDPDILRRMNEQAGELMNGRKN